jgi:hypothetical protein
MEADRSARVADDVRIPASRATPRIQNSIFRSPRESNSVPLFLNAEQLTSMENGIAKYTARQRAFLQAQRERLNNPGQYGTP